MARTGVNVSRQDVHRNRVRCLIGPDFELSRGG